MALSEILTHLDFVQLLFVPILMLLAVGYVGSGRFKMFFSDRRGNHSPATVIKGASEYVPECFIHYRSGKYVVDTDCNRKQQRTSTKELDDSFQEDLNTVIQTFNRLSCKDNINFKYNESIFQGEMDKLSTRLGRLSLIEREDVNWCQLNGVVRNERRMLRKREKKTMMALQKAEEERWAKTEELERQRVLKAREKRERKDLMMRVTGKGQQLLPCRQERELMGNFTCLRILLLKNLSGDPWMKPCLKSFD